MSRLPIEYRPPLSYYSVVVNDMGNRMVVTYRDREQFLHCLRRFAAWWSMDRSILTAEQVLSLT